MWHPRLSRFRDLTFKGGCLLASCILLGLSFASQVFAIANAETRLLLVTTAIVCLLTLLVFLVSALKTRSRHAAYTAFLLLFLASALVIHFVFPNRSANPDGLRDAYVRRVVSFSNVKYVWGGESHFGIDCSGLVRIGLCEAMLERGFVVGSLPLIRSAARFWWQDMTARCMLDHKYGYTRTIGHADKLSAPVSVAMLAGEALRKGDLAVTDNGVHVLVYTGGGRWTEANPNDGKVVTNGASGSPRAYFNMPVTFLRLRVFDEPSLIHHQP